MVRSESIDCIVVYSLDRFSRDPVHGVILMQELEKHGVSLEAATETVDDSEVGKLVTGHGQHVGVPYQIRPKQLPVGYPLA